MPLSTPRILLLHEFSGVHTELKSGLRALGVDADIATFGDYHKGYGSDLNLGSVEPGIAPTIGRMIHQLRNVAAFQGYDIIQSISPTPFNKAVSLLVERLVIAKGGPKYVYVSAGSDSFYRRNCLSLAYHPPHAWHRNSRLERLETRIARRADAVVSALWDYDFTMRKAGFAPRFIPLPVDLAKIEPVAIGDKERIRVYHPLNREEGNDFKGTTYIRAAFEQLRGEFGESVEFIERGGMSFADYSRFTQTVDVVVDQTNSYAYGMSALYGLARGQVVLSGNEPATHSLHPHAESPVINIRPAADDIVGVLRSLLHDRSQLKAIGAAGRAYAQRYHSAKTVAQQYLNLYEDVLRGGMR